MGAKRFCLTVTEQLARLVHHGLRLPCTIPHDAYVLDLAFVRHPIERPFAQWFGTVNFRDNIHWLESRDQDFPGRVWRGAVADFELSVYAGIPWVVLFEDVPEGLDGEELIEFLADPPRRNTVYPCFEKTAEGEVRICPHWLDARGNPSARPRKTIPSWREQFKRYYPAPWRQYERQMRHATGCFISWHNLEAERFVASAREKYYPKIPTFWPDVEVPYGFNCAGAVVTTYLPSQLHAHQGALEAILRSEWAYWVSLHLLFEARAGQLWWVPYELRRDVRAVGLTDRTDREKFSATERKASRELAKLLDCIDAASWQDLPHKDVCVTPEWPKVPVRYMGGVSPKQPGLATSVFETPDWVLFAPVTWELPLPKQYLVKGHGTDHATIEHPRRRRVFESTKAAAYDPTIDEARAEWRASRMASLSEAERAAVEAALQRKKPSGSSRDNRGGISKGARRNTGLRSRPAPRMPTSPSAEDTPCDTGGSSARWHRADKDNEPMDDGK